MKNERVQGAGEQPPEIRNFARLCVENPHITWVLLIGTIIWGIYGYTHMPQRKDPDIPLKMALVETRWPGASAEKVEELVTKTVEKVIASNSKISKIDSTSRSGTSVIIFSVSDDLKDASQVLDDIGGRLAGIRNLPNGAGPINYQRDFGDTATLMLTVASPKAEGAELDVRAMQIRDAVESVRPNLEGASQAEKRASLILCFPQREDFRLTRLGAVQFVQYLRSVDKGWMRGSSMAQAASEPTCAGRERTSRFKLCWMLSFATTIRRARESRTPGRRSWFGIWLMSVQSSLLSPARSTAIASWTSSPTLWRKLSWRPGAKT